MRLTTLARTLDHPVLPKDEQIALVRKSQAGDRKATERLVRHNQRLILNIATKYQGRGLDLEDLVSEGNLGLLKGIEMFDPESGNALSTYVSWWIRQNIQRAADNTGSNIRKPVHVSDKARIVFAAISRLEQATGEEPTDEELAHALNVQGRVYNDTYKTPFTPERIAKLKDVFRWTLSSDVEILDGLTYSDLHRAGDDTESEVLSSMDAAKIRELVCGLSDRDRKILVMRYGLDGSKPLTLRAIGAELNVSLERTRQLLIRAEDILRERCGLEPRVWRRVS